MKNKNILLIVLFVIILIIALTLVLVNGKNKNIVNEPYQSNVQEMKQYELNIEEEIKKELEQCEKDYKESIKKYSSYTRNDFYNEIRLNQNQEYCKISIVNKDDINIDDAYDLNGEKIEELPETTLNGKNIELDDSTNIEEGKYYILKAASNQSMYTYYYIWTLSSSGSSSLNLYCYTENESSLDEGITTEIIEN